MVSIVITSHVYFQSTFQIQIQNQFVKILQKTPMIFLKEFMSNNKVQTLLFLFLIQKQKQSLYIVVIFLTSGSSSDAEFFLHRIQLLFYHIPTIKTEPSLAYYIDNAKKPSVSQSSVIKTVANENYLPYCIKLSASEGSFFVNSDIPFI